MAFYMHLKLSKYAPGAQGREKQGSLEDVCLEFRRGAMLAAKAAPPLRAAIFVAGGHPGGTKWAFKEIASIARLASRIPENAFMCSFPPQCFTVILDT